MVLDAKGNFTLGGGRQILAKRCAERGALLECADCGLASEEDVFRRIGLPYVPPEFRNAD